MIPSTIRIGPSRWSVVADRVALHSVDADVNGVTGYDLQRITIDPDRPPDAVAVTLLHECLHAVWWTVGHRGEKLTEEEAVRSISPLLLSVLRDNPDLVSYLLGTEWLLWKEAPTDA